MQLQSNMSNKLFHSVVRIESWMNVILHQKFLVCYKAQIMNTPYSKVPGAKMEPIWGR